MYYERERKLSLDHSFVLQEKIVDKVPKLNQLGEDSDSEIQELLAWVTDNRSWWLTMTDLSKVNIGLLLKEKKDESFFTWNSYLLYEHLNNLCYSLEMLNEIVERGCSSQKTHQSYSNKHTSRDIDLYQHHAFYVKFFELC